jgi:monoterpene epsilon-lactone hydrolase
MASPQADAIKALIKQFQAQVLGGKPTLESMRAGGEGMAHMTAEPAGVEYTAVDAGGVAGQWVDMPGVDKRRVLFYVHGGGYVICSSNSHRKLVGHLAAAAGCRGLAIDYRLAPEHPHPTPVNDALASYRWLLAQGFDHNAIAISGDSAGGGLTMATLVAIRDAGLPAPCAGVALSPWVDLEGTGESVRTKASVDLLIHGEGLKMMAAMFLAGQDPRTPLAAPLYADVSKLPAVYIQVGGDEVLLDDSTRLATVLAAAGNAVRLDVFPEMQHVFQINAGNLPEADDAVARIGAFLQTRFGR